MSLQTAIKSDFLLRYPGEAARLIEEINPDQYSTMFSDLDVAAILPLLERLDPYLVTSVFANLSLESQRGVLGRCGTRLALFILEGMSDADQTNMLASLDDHLREDLQRLLAFSADTAGHFMEIASTAFRDTMSVAHVLEILRRSGQRRARSLYVVNADDELAGRVDVQDLALADPVDPVSALLIAIECQAELTTPREELANLFDQYRLDSIPVIDSQNRLMGVIRYQNLFDVVEQVATADIQKMVGASIDEKALSPVSFAVKKRLTWLHINLLTAFLAAAVVGIFEDIIAQFTALAILLPVVAGQSGNAGSQALAVTMRGLALKEISIRQWRRVLSKEVGVGFVNGLVLAFTCGLAVLVWSDNSGLALVIGVAMVSSMIAAGIAGALVPMVLIRLGQDPATAASIILTTVTDVAGFIAFLGTATLLSFML